MDLGEVTASLRHLGSHAVQQRVGSSRKIMTGDALQPHTHRCTRIRQAASWATCAGRGPHTQECMRIRQTGRRQHAQRATEGPHKAAQARMRARASGRRRRVGPLAQGGPHRATQAGVRASGRQRRGQPAQESGSRRRLGLEQVENHHKVARAGRGLERALEHDLTGLDEGPMKGVIGSVAVRVYDERLLRRLLAAAPLVQLHTHWQLLVNC